jgi:hypothetical protein
MVCFQTKYTNLGTFWRALVSKMFLYLMAICNTYLTDILGHFMTFWYNLCSFGRFFPVFWYHLRLKIRQPCQVHKSNDKKNLNDTKGKKLRNKIPSVQEHFD